MADQYLDITKDIVVAMIENDKIKLFSAPDNPTKENKEYIEEVCRIFDAIYQSVSKTIVK